MNAAPHTINQSRVRLSSRSPVRVEVINRQNPTGLHGHGFYEIIVVTHGEADHVTDEATERIRAGSVLILAPGQTHAYARCAGLGIINIYYLAEWFLADIRALRSIDYLVPLFFASNLYNRPPPGRIPHLRLDGAWMQQCTAELEEIRRRGEAGTVPLLYLEACFLKLLIILGQAYDRWSDAPPHHGFRHEIQRSLEEIEEIVAKQRTFGVGAVARRVGLSPDHFTRLFRAATGMSPMEYFQKHRIHHVCRRLLNSKKSVTEIAHEFGYADSTHLDRFFKRYQGTTPREYRRRFGEDKRVA